MIDFHSHVIPETIIAAMRADPERYATRIESEAGKCYLARGKLRLELLPEFSVAEAKLEAMDRKGIEISVISPGPQVFFYGLPENQGIEAARLVNDGIAAMVAKKPARLRGMATLPMQHPEAAVAEMERVAREHGFKGIELATMAPGGELADPRYRALLRRAQELKMTIFAHPNTIGTGGRLDCYYLTNLIGNPLETTIMVANLMFSGALDELPHLKMLLAHGGGFAPYQVGRFVHGHRVRPETRAHTASSAKDMLKRFYFDTLTHDAQALRYLIELVGAERIVVGTDSPFDMGDDNPRGTLSRLSPEEVATLRRNALRLLED
ncbi:MAG TPA: amidohydrolase family protein [Burkholderiales bacterium]|jgi:aminocarboxymuconate-semialdehyde decarboxylase|nr:amidohydrolase family protein [Burkholderiales bacterium]